MNSAAQENSILVVQMPSLDLDPLLYYHMFLSKNPLCYPAKF